MFDVLIFDGSWMLHRSLRATGELAHQGQATGGVYGVLQSLRSQIIQHRPSRCVVVGDRGYSARRKALSTAYKANRTTKTPEEASDRAEFERQKMLLHELYPSMGVRLCQLQGREADDIIALLVSMMSDQQLLVVSEDRDMLQLVSDTCAVWRPRAEQLVTPETFQALVGLANPQQWLLWRALIGDPGDGIYGVPGIGEKTALEMVAGAATIEDLYEAALSGANKRALKLLDHLDVPQRNLELLDLTLEVFEAEERERVLQDVYVNRAPEVDLLTLRRRFDEWGFASFLENFERWVIPFQGLV